jgi:hypothetical protein
MVFHTSKAPRAPEAEQTDSVIDKEKRTLDGFSSRRCCLAIPKKTLKSNLKKRT